MVAHEILVQTLGGIVAALGAVYVGWKLNRWDKAHASYIESSAAEAEADAQVEVAAIDMMKAILKSKEEEILRLSSRIANLEERIEAAESRYRQVLLRLAKYEKDVNDKTEGLPLNG